jgi:hypothetical protein
MFSIVTVIGMFSAEEIDLQTEEMTTIIDPGDETGRGTAGIDMQIGSDLQTGADAEVETEIIVTGETTLMIGLEDAARILLTRGPVAEVKTTAGSLHAD